MNDPLLEELLTQFLYHKDLLLARAGIAEDNPRRRQDWERMKRVWQPALEKMVPLVRRWDLDPGVALAACFAWAKKCRHPDGPQPNMLGSEKYLTSALGFFLDVPWAAVKDYCSKDYLIKRAQAAAEVHFAYLAKYLAPHPAAEHGERVLSLSGVPAIYRFAAMPMERAVVRELAPDILKHWNEDRLGVLWLEAAGWTYQKLADYYNSMK